MIFPVSNGGGPPMPHWGAPSCDMGGPLPPTTHMEQQHQQINCVEKIKDKKINNNKDKSNKYIEEKGEIIYDDDKYYIKIKNYKNRFIEWTINGEKKII